jgi:hypothetical protein
MGVRSTLKTSDLGKRSVGKIEGQDMMQYCLGLEGVASMTSAVTLVVSFCVTLIVMEIPIPGVPQCWSVTSSV